MVTKASFAFFSKDVPKPYSIGKVIQHKHYRGKDEEYLRV